MDLENNKEIRWVRLFLSLFVLIGVCTLLSIFLPDAPKELTEKWWARILSGGAFALAGSGFLYFLDFSMSRRSEMEKLKTQYPDEPWKWDPMWLRGQIKQITAKKYVWLFMGILFILLTAPVIFKLSSELKRDNYGALMVLLFPLAGIGMIFSYLKSQFIEMKYGISILQIDNGVGVLGGHLKGAINIPKGTLNSKKCNIMLNCIKIYYSGSGKNRSRREELVWQEKVVETIRKTGRGSTVNFQIKIPFDIHQTVTEGKIKYEWRLQCEIKSEEINYESLFLVPIFRTPDSNNLKTQKTIRHKDTENRPLKDFQCFNIEPNQGEDLVIHFKKGQSKMIGIYSFLFGLAFFSIGLGIGYYGLIKESFGFLSLFIAIFPLAFCGIGLLLMIIGVSEVFRSSSFSIRGQNLRFRKSILGIVDFKEIPLNQILDVKVTSQTKAGNKIWYDIKLKIDHENRRHQKLILPARIPDKNEIDWLATQVEKRISKKNQVA